MIVGMMRLRRRWIGGAAATAMLTMAAPVFAELPKEPSPINEAPSPWVAYAITAVLVLSVVAVSLINAKRTHLD